MSRSFLISVLIMFIATLALGKRLAINVDKAKNVEKNNDETPDKSTATPAANLPKLTRKQEVDLRLLKEGRITLTQIRKKLRNGVGVPPKPVPDDEIEEYIQALEAHLPPPKPGDLPQLEPLQRWHLRLLQEGPTKQAMYIFAPGMKFFFDDDGFVQDVDDRIADDQLDAAFAKIVKFHVGEQEEKEYNQETKGDLEKVIDSATKMTKGDQVFSVTIQIGMSIEEMRSLLKRGVRIVNTPMSDDEIDDYVALLEAHLQNGNANNIAGNAGNIASNA